MVNARQPRRVCPQCSNPLKPGDRLCHRCGTAAPPVVSHEPFAAEPITPQRPAAASSPKRRRSPWPFIAIGCVAILLVAGAIGAIALAPHLRRPAPADPIPVAASWDDATSTPLLATTIEPSSEVQSIAVGEAMVITMPEGFLEKPQQLTVAALDGGPDLLLPLRAQPLGTYEVKLGDLAFFEEPLLIELPYDPDQLESPLPPEFALVASYWDEELAEWIEMPSFVDTARRRLVIPTFHLTKIRYDCVIADGHIYNDYFSVKYDREEMAALQSLHPDYADIYAAHPDRVFNILNDARLAYERAGFRDLEKIAAVEEKVFRMTFQGPVEHKMTLRRYNVYIHGDATDQSWTWKGIAYSSLSRSKYTGNIYIPYSYQDDVCIGIAHEVFHSVQNRYYNLVGMTEIKTPGTTTPVAGLLVRQWWLEGTAEYAAGALACPAPDGSPHPEMGGELDHRRLEKPLAYSPSILYRGSDRPAYNNAWFIAFLVNEKGIDFRDMFEAVASYQWPSVYDNLVTYLGTKQLDIYQVYAEFAVWWYFDPASPLQRGTRAGVVPLTALTEAAPGDAAGMLTEKVLLKVPGQDLRSRFVYETLAGDHRTQIREIRVGEIGEAAVGRGSAAQPPPRLEPRTLIFHWENAHLSSVNYTWLLLGKLSPGISPLVVTRIANDQPLVIETLDTDQALYVLAIRQHLGATRRGTAGETPTFRVTEAELTIEPPEIVDGSPNQRYTFTATARNIPEPLVSRLRFEWQSPSQPNQTVMQHDLTYSNDTVSAALADQQFPVGEHIVTVRLYADGATLLAEAQARIRILEPGEAGSVGDDDDDEPAASAAGHWRLVETIEAPGSTEGDGNVDGANCSTTTASWSNGNVTSTISWPASSRDKFYPCENSGNMTYVGVLSWTPPPASLYPEQEITLDAKVANTTFDTRWPAVSALAIWRGNSKVCGISSRGEEGAWECPEPTFVIPAGNPQAGERGTRLEIVVAVNVAITWSTSKDFAGSGRYTYVYEWVP